MATTRVETINSPSPARVAVVFEQNRIRPVWFEYNREKIRIQENCYTWSHREGAATILNFGVWDGKETYELHYNTRSFIWTVGIMQKTEINRY